MPKLPFEIRHGRFLDVTGQPIRYGCVTFVPAEIKLEGNGFSPVFRLFDWCISSGLTIPAIVNGEENAPWVLGRLMALFNTENTPEDKRSEKSCFYASFLAVLNDEQNIAIPFECFDYYGQTALYFSSENPPPGDHQKTIADAYYALLLDDPNELINYENRMYDFMSGEWITFGVNRGQPYMDPEID